MKRHIATGVFMLAVLFMASSVCAGVMRVLADIVNGFGWKEYIVAWLLCGVVALGATLIFLEGSIRLSVKLLSRI